MKCPRCDNEMEAGVVSTHYNRYIVWSEKAIKTVFSGEEIPPDAYFFTQHIDGHRSRECKLIIMQYIEDDRQIIPE
jgi:hypothetical protein